MTCSYTKDTVTFRTQISVAKFLILILLLGMLPAASGSNAQCVDFRDYMHKLDLIDLPTGNPDEWGPYRSAYTGGFLFKGRGNQINVVDANDPGNLRYLGPWNMGRTIDGIQATSDHLFVVTGEDGIGYLTVIAGIPFAPVVVTTLDLPANGTPYLHDDRLWIGGGNSITLVDVGIPSSPVVMDHYSLPDGSAGNLACEGDYIFVSDFTFGLQIISATNPNELQRIGIYETSGTVSIAVVGDNVFLAKPYDRAIETVDVGDPSTPTFVTSQDQLLPFLLVQNGNNVWAVLHTEELDIIGGFRTDSMGGLDIFAQLPSPVKLSIGLDPSYGELLFSGDELLLVTDDVVCSYDISLSESPQMVSQTPMSDRNAGPPYPFAMIVKNGWGYVLGLDQMEIFNLMSPSNPTSVSAFPSLNWFNPEFIVENNHAYIEGSSEINIFDLSDPYSPVHVDSFPFIGSPMASAEGFGFFSNQDTLFSFDLTNPISPTPVDTLVVVGNIVRVKIDWPRIFILERDGGGEGDDGVGQNTVSEWGSFLYHSQPERLVLPGIIDIGVIFMHPWYSQLVVSTGTSLLSYITPSSGGYNLVGITDLVNYTNQLEIKGTIAYSYSWDRFEVSDLTLPDSPLYLGSMCFENQLEYNRAFAVGTSFVGAARRTDEGTFLSLFPNQCGFVTATPEETPKPPQRHLSASPNPFNPGTNVSFSLASSGQIELSVFDLSGRRIVTLMEGYLDAGFHEAYWNGQDSNRRKVSSGIYFLQLREGNRMSNEKITLIK